jgi:hypothetical protein
MSFSNSRKVIKNVLYHVAFVISLCAMPLANAENKSNMTQRSQGITNVGFESNPPEALRKRFPMCDEFLTVKWIDKTERIGYTRFDLYRDGKRDGTWWALVHIHQWYPHFDYDVRRFLKNGRLDVEKLSTLIQRGEIDYPDTTLVIRADKDVSFSAIEDVRDVHGDTLSDHLKNICIPYPDNDRMWIAEYKWMGKVYKREEIEAKREKVKQFFPKDSIPQFEIVLPIDINFDGQVSLPSKTVSLS